MISVVMATYNGEEFIEKQLESIRNQSLKPDEVIICDDCSTDSTERIIVDFIKKYNLLTWKYERNTENLGYYRNFVNCVEKCNGDTIYFSDQDDIWDLNKIMVFESTFRNHKDVTLIQSNYLLIDANDKIINNNINYHESKNRNNISYLNAFDICRYAGAGFTMAFRKEVIEFVNRNKLSSYSKTFECHDLLYSLAAIAIGKIIFIKNVVDRHRLHNKNCTQKIDKSFVYNRSAHIQIRNVVNRQNRMKLLIKCNNILSTSRKEFIRFYSFNFYREQWISCHNIFYYIKMIKYINCYQCKKVILADFLYGMGLEKIVMKSVK